MDEKSVFHLISDASDEYGISCVLIGGFAINFYKVSRQTADVDFLITKDDFNEIANVLRNAGYKEMQLHDNFVQFESNNLSLLNVDFMFVDSDTLTKIKNEGQRISIAGKDFIVPSIFHLIALKLHSIKYNFKNRFLKDFPDIVNLIKVNKIDIRNESFKELCLKYGTDELYKKILEATL